MRGKRPACGYRYRPGGNIPAYAGKTAGAVTTLHQVEEHPRVCGENIGGFWGLPWALRNIPAYAGKTLVMAFLTAVTKEHPRVCGENDPMDIWHTREAGTSPRMRGKQHIYY